MNDGNILWGVVSGLAILGMSTALMMVDEIVEATYPNYDGNMVCVFPAGGQQLNGSRDVKFHGNYVTYKYDGKTYMYNGMCLLEVS